MEPALYKKESISNVRIEVLINLQNYQSIRVGVDGEDAEQCRLCLIETLSMTLPINGEVEKACVMTFMKNILVNKAFIPEQKEGKHVKKRG